MQFPRNTAEVVNPIEFKDEHIAGLLIRRAYIEDDIVIQVLKASNELPMYAAHRVAKALVNTIGEPAMESVKIEPIDNELIEGGSSVYVKCLGMNTAVIKSIMFPRFYQALEVSMQES